jgi:hydrogenase maturation protease
MMTNHLVIGVGNEFRGDDAAGIIVARRLGERNLPGVTTVEQSGEGADLLATWEGQESVFLVDAAQSGAEPGTIHRFDAHKERLPTDSFHFSSHAFGVVEAIEIARNLGQLPANLIVFGVEGENFKAGSGVSTSVQLALDQVIRLIRHEIERIHY